MADGTAIRVSDTKKGECAVVLLHGYLESLDVWDDFTSLLSPHVRVVAVDLPGHGVSEVKGEIHTMEFMADTVHAAMEVMNVPRAVIVGHSMGGYAALEVVRKYPQTVAGLVLFHSIADADTEKKRRDRLREIEIIRGGKKELIARSFPAVGFAPQNRQRLRWAVEELADQICMTEDEGIMAVLRGVRERSDLNDMLRESPVPQMALFGCHDEYVSQESAQAFAEGHPRAHVVWLADSGHMGFIEEPEKSAEAILSFAAQVCR